MMRLRLRIERNELPPVSLLWPVSPAQQQNTIAQLLESVDKAIPLETEHWGFEDYIVAVGGYECLQYHQVSAICNSDDEVVVRPRTWAETRARTLLGRSRITQDGRKLEDGVAFGRTALRGPVRPKLKIPKRKRKRDTEEENDDDQEVKRVRFIEEVQDEDDEDDEEDDEDFELPEESEELEEPEEAVASASNASSSSDSDSSSEVSSSDSDATSDSDSDLNSDSSGSSSDLGDSSSGSSDSSSDSSSDEEIIGRSGRRAKAMRQASAHAKYPRDGRPTGLLANYHAATQNSQIVVPTGTSQAAEASEATEERKQVPPGKGRKETKDRNHRRRDSKRLKYLKSIGALPRNASLTTLNEWKKTNRMPDAAISAWKDQNAKEKDFEENTEKEPDMQSDPIMADESRDSTAVPCGVSYSSSRGESTTGPSNGTGTLAAADVQLYAEEQRNRREKLLADLASGGVEVGQRAVVSDQQRDRRETLQAELAASGSQAGPGEIASVNEEMDVGPDEMSSKIGAHRSASNGITSAPGGDGPTEKTDLAATELAAESSNRRSKLDAKSAQRMLFGSLGVRVPKTQEQKDALQKKLAGEARKPVTKPVAAAEAEPEPAAEEAVPEDPDAWWYKIDLRAVECCDEGVTLSTPPYPFYQRWDPQYRGKKNRNMNSYAAGKRNRKRKWAQEDNGDFEETYDKYNITPEGDFLDYGEDDEYWEEGALMGDDGEDEEEDPAARQLQAEASATAKVDNFPPLPADISKLPNIPAADVRLGDYLVYTALVCSPATKWQPSMVSHTVQVREKMADDGDNVWKVTVALRDLPPKQFDDQGNRVYEKFEMAGASDDEGQDEEEDVKVLDLEGLGELKLLGRAEEVASGAADVAEAS